MSDEIYFTPSGKLHENSIFLDTEYFIPLDATGNPRAPPPFQGIRPYILYVPLRCLVGIGIRFFFLFIVDFTAHNALKLERLSTYDAQKQSVPSQPIKTLTGTLW